MDIVKRLLLSYRQALLDRDPEACADLDKQAHADPRISVLIPTHAPYDPDELFNDQDTAHLTHLAPATIRKWASDGLIERHVGEYGQRLYRIGEVQAVKQRQRLGRAARAS